MATATNTTAGQVLMAGDLAPSSNGSSPELRATGVTAGAYSNASMIIDAKGRVVYAQVVGNTDIANNVSLATVSDAGKVKIGTNVSVAGDGTISIPYATDTTYGVAQVGTNMGLDASGNLRVNTPNATSQDFGIVRIGAGLELANGFLTHTSFKNATTGSKGVVQISSDPDGGFTTDAGVASVRVATGTNAGVVLPYTEHFDAFDDSTIRIKDAAGGDYGAVYAIDTTTGLSLTDGALSFSGWDLSSVPIASANTAGKVKVGAGLVIDPVSGALSLDGLGPASASTLGSIRTGGGFTVDENSALTAPDATTAAPGVITVASGTNQFSFSAAAPYQDYAGLRFGRAIASAPGVVMSTSATSDLIINNGDISVSTNIPRKSKTNTYSKSVAVSPYAGASAAAPDFSASNVLTMSTSGNMTIGAPVNAIAGQVTTMLITATADCAITFDANYRLNQTSTIALTSGTTLSVSIITLTPTKNIVMVQGTF